MKHLPLWQRKSKGETTPWFCFLSTSHFVWVCTGGDGKLVFVVFLFALFNVFLSSFHVHVARTPIFAEICSFFRPMHASILFLDIGWYVLRGFFSVKMLCIFSKLSKIFSVLTLGYRNNKRNECNSEHYYLIFHILTQLT